MPNTNKLPFVGDVVCVDLDQCADKQHWEPLCKIKGVVIHLTYSELSDTEPNIAQVIWIDNESLTLHWQRSTLKVIKPFRPMSIHLDFPPNVCFE